MNSFCPKNHPRSHKCYQVPPNSCAKCDDEYARTLKEAELRRRRVRQEQEAAYQRAYHAKQLAEHRDIGLRGREPVQYRQFGEGPRSFAGPVAQTSYHRFVRLPNPSATPPSNSTSGIFEAPNRIAKPALISRISSPLQHRGMPRASQALSPVYKTESRHDTETASRTTLYVQDAGVAYSNWGQYAIDRAREEDATRRAQHALRAQEYQDAKMARRQAEHRERKVGLEARISDWPTEFQHQDLQREWIEHGQGSWSGEKRKRDSQEELWRQDKRIRQDTERRGGV